MKEVLAKKGFRREQFSHRFSNGTTATTPQQAAKEFAEWASLFSGRLFVKIVVYADESGTHDPTGAKKGSREGIIGGIAAIREDWTVFCREWRRVLNDYSVLYFHFYEWADASAVARKTKKPSSDFANNPYRHLDLSQLNELLVALAKIAGSGNKIIVGGSVYTQLFHKAKFSGDIPPNADPYEHCMDQFFESVVGLIGHQRPPWKKLPISFFFDQTDNDVWIKALNNRFRFYQKQYSTFREIAFADKKIEPHLPLQAADMVAYRMRQIGGNWVDKKPPAATPMIDELLFKSTFDFLDMHKKEVFRAFLSGQLDYEYWEKK